MAGMSNSIRSYQIKPMDINKIQPSRQYQWVYQPEAQAWCEGHLKKGGRAGLPDNDLFGRVSVRAVKSGQAASAEMYVNKALALDPTYAPDPNYTPRWEVTSNPCVVRSLATGDFQVRIMGSKTRKIEYFVDGRPATTEEIARIDMFRKARKERNSKVPKVEFIYLNNLANVETTFADMPEDIDLD